MNEELNQNNEISKEEIKKELKEAKAQERKREEIKVKKSKARMYIVLVFLILTAIVGYIIFRGEYLEILEIGQQYVSIFWQNLNSKVITFILFYPYYLSFYYLYE